jgi:hypothetical protein
MLDISTLGIGSVLFALLIAPPLVTAALVLFASLRQKIFWRDNRPADDFIDAM